jgi:hypothetical protein
MTCLELRVEGRRGWGREAGEKNDPNNVCTCEQKNRKKKNAWLL